MIAQVQMSSSKSALMYKHYWFDFVVLKALKVSIHLSRAPVIKEVIWNHPPPNWVKCNVDKDFSFNPESSGYGGILRLHNGLFVLVFTDPFIWKNYLLYEFCSVLWGIEIARDRGWKYLLVDSDLIRVVKAFYSSNYDLVPWKLRSRWFSCLKVIIDMSFIISHTYREGNNCDFFF